MEEDPEVEAYITMTPNRATSLPPTEDKNDK
jgi:hypothetical protein